MEPTIEYTPDEVAAHNHASDCWVIVHGAVVDVTAFLQVHPGGINAICQPGRAGLDVSSHFNRIGHSDKAKSILKGMQIGILVEAQDDRDENTSLLSQSLSNMKKESPAQIEREHAIRWHAARRKAILRDHPEIADLIGSNPWTLLMGLLTVAVHIYTCLCVQTNDFPWYGVIFAAYTVGAVCKMWQFAVNHDICHGTAGSWLEKYSFLKHAAMQIMTLPTMGGAMHTYYEFQHIGHHASLGVHSLGDVLGVGDYKEGEEERLQDKKERKVKIDTATLQNMLFFPDSDGDLFAIGNLSFGKILERWGLRLSDSESGQVETNIRRYIELEMDTLEEFHKYTVLKCMAIQILHVSHQAAMAIVLYVQTLPLVPFISIPLFLFPQTATKYTMKLVRYLNDNQRIMDDVSEETEMCLVYTMYRIVASVGLHAWVSLILVWWLLFGHLDGAWTLGSVAKGFFYLYLSELFLYGFGMHPFMGYFLGVHRSGGVGFESKKDTPSAEADTASSGCQPTMSTYSQLAALASMNLTHHVEHHDFPGIPWSRLPTVTRLAPEYYDHLEQSPGFCATIYRWIHYSGGWGYACH